MECGVWPGVVSARSRQVAESFLSSFSPAAVITCPCLLPPSLQNYAAMKLVKPFS